VGINKTTEGHLNYLLHEAKKEQVHNVDAPTTSTSQSIFKRDSFPSRGRLIRNGTLDAKLQKELLGNHENKCASYHKLQVSRWHAVTSTSTVLNVASCTDTLRYMALLLRRFLGPQNMLYDLMHVHFVLGISAHFAML